MKKQNKNYLFESMSNIKNEWNQYIREKNELLKVLVEGCRIHPGYRARRKATERCAECVLVWKARLELNELEECQK